MYLSRILNKSVLVPMLAVVVLGGCSDAENSDAKNNDDSSGTAYDQDDADQDNRPGGGKADDPNPKAHDPNPKADDPDPVDDTSRLTPPRSPAIGCPWVGMDGSNTYEQFLENEAFEPLAEKPDVTVHFDELDHAIEPLTRERIWIALWFHSESDFQSFEEAFAPVEDYVTIKYRRQRDTSREFAYFDLRLGGNEDGAIFVGDSTKPTALFDDGALVCYDGSSEETPPAPPAAAPPPP